MTAGASRSASSAASMRRSRCPGGGYRRDRCHGCGLASQRPWMAETIALLEQFEIDQRPEEFLVILPPAFMLDQKPLDLDAVADLPRDGAGRIDMIADKAAHWATEPLIDGDAKTDLRAAQNLAGQNVLH